MLWCLTSPGKFYDRGEGVVVYFHPASGDTHLFTDFAVDLLRKLAAGPADLAILSEPYFDPAGEVSIEEYRDAIEAVLEQLAQLDLVEPR